MTTMTASRELVALNADIVGYSRLMADDFEATTETVKRYHQLVRQQITKAGGSLVNFVGDNFMAVFDEVTQAVGAAIAISSAIEHLNEETPEREKVRFRMGIDKGPVTVADGDYLGEALNIAARIQALARPGGLSVSGVVFRALDEPALRFRSTGVRQLKNIPEGVEVFEFADLPSDDGDSLPSRRLALGPPAVAVLPIHQNGVTEDTASLPDLIRSDVLHRLTGVRNLKVMDISTEFDRPGDQTPQYLLETGFIQFGAQARVYAQLMEVATMNIVTSQKWTYTPEELAARSEDIAEEIARSIQVELIVGEPAREYSRLDDPEAIRKIYEGWYYITVNTSESMLKAIELFDQVADAHPELPIGVSLSAFAHWAGAAEGLFSNPSEHFAKAAELAAAGTAMEDKTGLAQMVQAAILMSTGQVDDALELLEDVQITRPTCDVTYGLEGSVRRYLGQWEKSVDLLDVAMRLTAMNKPWYPTVQACSFYMGNRLEAAASTAQSVIDYQPRNLEALLVLAAAQVELGQVRRARATAQLVRERFPAVDVGEWLDRRPYQDRELIARWKMSLAGVGLIERPS